MMIWHKSGTALSGVGTVKVSSTEAESYQTIRLLEQHAEWSKKRSTQHTDFSWRLLIGWDSPRANNSKTCCLNQGETARSVGNQWEQELSSARLPCLSPVIKQHVHIPTYAHMYICAYEKVGGLGRGGDLGVFL